MTDEQLFATALGILHLQQRQRVAVFVRRDDFDRFISCLVFVPRDRYTTQLRLAIQAILERAFAGEVSAHYLQVGDAPLARLHIVVQTTPGEHSPLRSGGAGGRDRRHARSWSDRLLDALKSRTVRRRRTGCTSATRWPFRSAIASGSPPSRRSATSMPSSGRWPKVVSIWRSTGRSPQPTCSSASRSISPTSRSSCRRCCRCWSTWACGLWTRCRMRSASGPRRSAR